MSLGRACIHKLPNKLDQAQKHGFEGIEVFYEDLDYFAQDMEGGATPENLLEAAHQIKKLCDDRSLTVIALQPFWQYEGLKDRKEHAAKIEKMKLWFKLAKALGTTVIQIPSSFLKEEEITSDIDAIVQDMVEVAEMGLKEDPVINFAYESLAWATYVDTWDQCWEVIEKVNRPNFGACLDTFNIAGRVYADPASPDGKTPNAEADIRASIERLIKTVDAKKVFFVQVVDAERLEEPLVEGHEYYAADQPARMSWSRNCRLFYGEEDLGGYLPIKEITKAFLHDLKFDGWVSMELFSRHMAYDDPGTPAWLAERGQNAWKKIVKDLNLETG
ncbi:hypothetical protein H2201_001857 [Coniosporium apollinis]|uniref:Xylose isomerase-like TIM barrel domain-containing protein n=2 Tax=Coniosporium TaxID=2810619 RepID=A0ABQ9P248_9PEZI|nr:hypothetical protein H2199_000491 [Cladosporium sp. JES 115]KAJ9668051.1 hypothetical protein H2201_001857 [Coniosporium apollinis]